MSKIILHEDAKDDWLKIVKKHKKKQKGLPALSRLNTDAGDVETQVNMFNKMNSGSDNLTNNPVSGPFGDNISSSSVTESIKKDVSYMNSDMIELTYSNLELDDVPTGRTIKHYGEEPDENEVKDVTTEYTYHADKESVIEFLSALPEVQEKYWSKDMSDDEYSALVEEKLDELVEEFKSKLLDHYQEYAVEEARDKFEFDDIDDYDPYDYMYESVKSHTNLDDDFDMSMRTLI